jgi:hypothetical protein
MIETLIVAYILLAFSFPLHSLALTLGVATTWILYRGSFLLKKQPEMGKQIIWILMKTSIINFFLSLLLGGAMASFVFFAIYDNYYLFLFNIAFCSIISLRWFDYSYKLYERQIKKLKIDSDVPPFFNISKSENKAEVPLFAVCMGLSKKTGIGGGMTPIFVDSGYLFEENNKLVFDGVFLRHVFDRETILDLEKISSEKIKIFSRIEPRPFKADAFLLILKCQFYPFKARDSRDRIVEMLATMLETPSEGLHLDQVKDKMPGAFSKY